MCRALQNTTYQIQPRTTLQQECSVYLYGNVTTKQALEPVKAGVLGICVLTLMSLKGQSSPCSLLLSGGTREAALLYLSSWTHETHRCWKITILLALWAKSTQALKSCCGRADSHTCADKVITEAFFLRMLKIQPFALIAQKNFSPELQWELYPLLLRAKFSPGDWMRLSFSLNRLSSVGFRHFLHAVLTQLFAFNEKQLSFLLTCKQRALSMSSGVPACLPLNRWSWPDTGCHLAKKGLLCQSIARSPAAQRPLPLQPCLVWGGGLSTQQELAVNVRKTSS